MLDIGGVKEKVIAAHRAHIKTIILPKDNKKDLEDIPSYVLKDLNFVFVSHMDEVIKVALVFQDKEQTFPSFSQNFATLLKRDENEQKDQKDMN